MKSLTNDAVIIATIVTGTFYMSCSSDPETDNTPQVTQKSSFISPAIAGADIAFDEFKITPEKGDTILYKSGTVIIFPPNSIVDKSGNPVAGNVDISYREFYDPVDFFLSGIPMNYDSGGINYTFESAAMCEIYAFQNNEPLFVNTALQPEIHLAAANKDIEHNLYFLDTISRQWIFKGKDIMTDVNNKPKIKSLPAEVAEELIPPTKPQEADATKSSFLIIIEPGSVRELSVYNNMKFEIDEDEKNFNPKRNIEYWDDVMVEKTSKKGTFRVTFTSKKEKVSYLGRPVYEGKDYEEALKEFELKQKEFDLLVRQRLSKEKKEREEIEKQNAFARAESDRIERMNKFIELKNKETEERNRLLAQNTRKMEGRRKEMLARRVIEEKEKQERIEDFIRKKELEEKRREETAFVEGGAEVSRQIFRTFTLEGFGAWNIDKPMLQRAVRIAATYVDKEGNNIQVQNVNVAYNEFNGIFSFRNDSIDVIPNRGNMILGVVGNKFAYLTPAEFINCSIDSFTTDYTFSMNVYPGEIKSREDIKRIAGL